MKFPYHLILTCVLSCNTKTELEKKLVNVSDIKYWKILKWNKEDYSHDTLLLKFYSNNEYDFFRYNKKKKIVVSLKPSNSSDIIPYQYWEVKNDSLLSFKKRVDFNYSLTRNDTMWFVGTKDSLIMMPFSFDGIK